MISRLPNLRSAGGLCAVAIMICMLSSCTRPEAASLTDGSVIPVTAPGEPFSDPFREYLKEELQGVRILALGETAHEDGATFTHKAGLVRFLHEELGFTVLAFEFGFYGHWLINEKIRQGEGFESATRYAGWANNRQSLPVYDYLYHTLDTDPPLTLAGFDGEKVPDGVPNIRALVDEISELTRFTLTENDSLAVDSLIAAVYGPIGNPVFQQFSFGGRTAATAVLQDLRQQVQSQKESLSADGNSERWMIHDLTLRSILMDVKSDFAGGFWNIVRDKSMAERVRWLADSLYPGEKIILWGASAHFARNMVLIERTLDEGAYGFYPYFQQGDWLHTWYGDEYYSIAFTAGEGRRGTVFPDGHPFKQYESIRDLADPDTASFEYAALQSGQETLYTSLNVGGGLRHDQPFIAYPLGYNRDRTTWGSVFDAFYFIRRMTPIEHLSN